MLLTTEEQVLHFPGALHRLFDTRELAEVSAAPTSKVELLV